MLLPEPDNRVPVYNEQFEEDFREFIDPLDEQEREKCMSSCGMLHTFSVTMNMFLMVSSVNLDKIAIKSEAPNLYWSSTCLQIAMTLVVFKDVAIQIFVCFYVK